MNELPCAHFRRPQALLEPRAESRGREQSGTSQSPKGTLEFRAVPLGPFRLLVAGAPPQFLHEWGLQMSGAELSRAPSLVED